MPGSIRHTAYGSVFFVLLPFNDCDQPVKLLRHLGPPHVGISYSLHFFRVCVLSFTHFLQSLFGGGIA